jgi:RNA-directed DNA polymerase
VGLTPGDLGAFGPPQGGATGVEETAEAVVAAAHGGEGPNRRSRTGSNRSMDGRDADRRACVPQERREVGGGTAERPAIQRHAHTARGDKAGQKAQGLMEEVVRRENLLAAYQRVRSNHGAPGIDGMTVEALADFCREHWERVREELLGGTYVPQPVRRVEIPKPDGKGVRMLGIPERVNDFETTG